MKKLENGVLEGVNIGDSLCLKADNGDIVGGFVVRMTPGKVKLSHEHPGNEDAYAVRNLLNLTQGNRNYYL